MSPINLDLDILRTLLAAQRLGSFNRAALAVGRSQSAVSQQIAKLEQQMGVALFSKQGRGLIPTEAGAAILSYGQRILAMNDEAVLAVRGHGLDGAIRFGLPADLAESWLPAALGRFNRAHPAIQIDAMVERNSVLLAKLDQGELDLVLAFNQGHRPDAEPLARFPLVWIGVEPASPNPTGPIPLALYQAPCFFRQAAIATLDARGHPWRVAFTSTSLHGLWAAVGAGLGITVRTAIGLPPSLVILSRAPRAGLPALPEASLAFHDAGRRMTPALDRLRAILHDGIAQDTATGYHHG